MGGGGSDRLQWINSLTKTTLGFWGHAAPNLRAVASRLQDAIHSLIRQRAESSRWWIVNAQNLCFLQIYVEKTSSHWRNQILKQDRELSRGIWRSLKSLLDLSCRLPWNSSQGQRWLSSATSLEDFHEFSSLSGVFFVFRIMGQSQSGTEKEVDLQNIQELYRKFASECPSGNLHLHEFKKIFGINSSSTEEEAAYMENVFRSFDANKVRR